MSKVLAIILFLSFGTYATGQAEQTIPTEVAPVKVTRCDLFMHPDEYAGTVVRFRARIIGTSLKDMRLEVVPFIGSGYDNKCDRYYMSIVAALPEDVVPAPQFELVRDASLERLQSSIASERSQVEAEIYGRFDPVFVRFDRKRIRVGKGDGYGRRKAYDSRIVIHRVSDVLVSLRPVL